MPQRFFEILYYQPHIKTTSWSGVSSLWSVPPATVLLRQYYCDSTTATVLNSCDSTFISAVAINILQALDGISGGKSSYYLILTLLCH